MMSMFAELLPLMGCCRSRVRCRRQLPFAVEDFHGIWLFICLLLTALYAMQLVWMKGIVRVLR